MKIYFLDNNNNNQIFIVFRLEDVIKKNVQLFIDYFFNQMILLDITFDNLKYEYYIMKVYTYYEIQRDKKCTFTYKLSLLLCLSLSEL